MRTRSVLSVSFLFIFILLSHSSYAQTQVIRLAGTRGDASVSMGSRTDDMIQVTVPEAHIQSVAIEGKNWALVTIPNTPSLMNKGDPSLPFISFDYLLKENEGIRLELVNEQTQKVSLQSMNFSGIVPSKGHFSRNISPQDVPWVFNKRVYNGAKGFPPDGVRMGKPYIAGPLRGQSVQIPLARWSSTNNELTLTVRAQYRVVRYKSTANSRKRPAPQMNTLFDQAGRFTMVNYRSGIVGDVTPGHLLVLVPDQLQKAIQPLVDWEKKLGYPTTVTPLSKVGKTATAVLNYIRKVYLSPEGLSWILLVGDYEDLPNLRGLNEGAPCDACYTKLEGDDNRPDAAISRISARTAEEVSVQVQKILNYETNPSSGEAANWYKKAFGIASDEGSPTDGERMTWLENDLKKYNYSEFTELLDGKQNPSARDVGDSINDGRGLGLYIGHGAETYWVTSGFSVRDAENLSNENKLPVVWDVACVNGAFHNKGDCLAEAFMKKSGGGAVSFEAATTNESWVPPCVAQRGVIDSIRLETAFLTGSQHVSGKLFLMSSYGDDNNSEGNMFMEQSTLFGNVILWPRTSAPKKPDYPSNLSLGDGSASLVVTVGGASFAKANGAIVSFYAKKGDQIEMVGSGVTDSNGLVKTKLTGKPTHVHIFGNNLTSQDYKI